MIEYEEYGAEALDRIQPLWEMLNRHHAERSTRFRERFEQLAFATRRQHLLKQAGNGKLRLWMARNTTTGRDEGYCVVVLGNDGSGEVASLFVHPEARKRGLGHELMTRALNWLEKAGATTKSITVVAGNEETFDFYARYGFFPSCTCLQQQKPR
ncbi:GNAT family N-acetyltransferase [Pseudodesulfovibrio tunisiensis]|uniref:GNAT family N-acetyltransferase n=1 Tax=Pseudodesulfovibrio tunisiensis TaxID=463192 RepID=UPI001FB1D1A1|nr:GNAT family N-acetyltransferase [Pseudodesulfovibrio tunisiensis]